MPALDQCIVDAAKTVWDDEFVKGTKNRDNCSGFVKPVARDLGIQLPAWAGGIADAVAAGWTAMASGPEAARLATSGSFVLAVLKAADHSPARNNGHVAIALRGDLYRQKCPVVWGGSIGSAQSRADKSVGEGWNRSDRDNVSYYAYATVASKK